MAHPYFLSPFRLLPFLMTIYIIHILYYIKYINKFLDLIIVYISNKKKSPGYSMRILNCFKKKTKEEKNQRNPVNTEING
jgi:hypothetical protein